ncbi:hypothetical protein B0T24DRAFT_429020 [Lasiosphaeria ovina]|uniref:Secreted protein n=1 Tax=Lasiosphaeria ovina TaxID=92902 RepID=A0AAE0JVU7_9PEZI|nr:hypothetical protein B0T24DRAFT_429020 [Lasiosphaeria ovina]
MTIRLSRLEAVPWLVILMGCVAMEMRGMTAKTDMTFERDSTFQPDREQGQARTFHQIPSIATSPLRRHPLRNVNIGGPVDNRVDNFSCRLLAHFTLLLRTLGTVIAGGSETGVRVLVSV